MRPASQSGALTAAGRGERAQRAMAAACQAQAGKNVAAAAAASRGSSQRSASTRAASPACAYKVTLQDCPNGRPLLAGVLTLLLLWQYV